MLPFHKLTVDKCSVNMLSVLKLTHILNLGFLEPRNTGATCVGTTLSPAQLRAVLAKIGSTCARTTCVLGALVTGSTWTLEQLVHGQHELQGHLLHGQHEHWVKLLHGTVVQGRVNIASDEGGWLMEQIETTAGKRGPLSIYFFYAFFPPSLFSFLQIYSEHTLKRKVAFLIFFGLCKLIIWLYRAK